MDINDDGKAVSIERVRVEVEAPLQTEKDGED
jgi:hypothetical protein